MLGAGQLQQALKVVKILVLLLSGIGDRGNYGVAIHKTAQILTRSTSSDNLLKQTILRIENARVLSESAIFALMEKCFPGGGWFSGGSQESKLTVGRCLFLQHIVT